MKAAPKGVQCLTAVDKVSFCSLKVSKTAKKLLNFRIRNDSEGIWVRCDKCNMWRYVHNLRDPNEMSERKFFCKDVRKKCNGPADDGSDEVFYETDFCAGSLVWAKRPNGPNKDKWAWWPAIVEDSLDEFSQYFLLDPVSNEAVAYHVTYLDSLRSGAWLRSELLKPFDSTTNMETNSNSITEIDTRYHFQEAVNRALNAAKFHISKRLENFSFIAYAVRHEEGMKDPETADLILNGLQAPKSSHDGRNSLGQSPKTKKRGSQAELTTTWSNESTTAKIDKNSKIKASLSNVAEPVRRRQEVSALKRKSAPAKREKSTSVDKASVSKKQRSYGEGSEEFEAETQTDPKTRTGKAASEPNAYTTIVQDSSPSSSTFAATQQKSQQKRDSRKNSYHDSGLESLSEASLRVDSSIYYGSLRSPKFKKKDKKIKSGMSSFDSLTSAVDSTYSVESTPKENMFEHDAELSESPLADSDEQDQSVFHRNTKSATKPLRNSNSFTQPLGNSSKNRKNSHDSYTKRDSGRSLPSSSSSLSQPTFSQRFQKFTPPTKKDTHDIDYTIEDLDRDITAGLL